MNDMKFKKPRLPRCPNISEIRADFRQMSERLRAARHEYIAKCAEASKHLRGKPLANYIVRVADKMQANGLYAPTTYVRDIAWSVARWFARREVSGEFYHWFWKWLEQRGMTTEMLRGVRRGRGRRREVA